MTLPNLDDEFEKNVLTDNNDHKEDYGRVLSFIRLKGRPSRPIDAIVVARSPEDFRGHRQKLPEQFFEPFNRLLRLVGFPELRVEPDLGAVQEWNDSTYVPKLVSQIGQWLDDGDKPRLVPTLVWAFRNLERERLPATQEWPAITAIAIPGSRTYDRAAEAYRAYLQTEGGATLITSGRSPYYDAETELTESEANAAYLRLLGVPRERIIPEAESRDTEENAEYLIAALRQIEHHNGTPVSKLLLVTSPFHLARYRLNVEMMLEVEHPSVKVYAIGSRASRYWAETYFMIDAKSGYTREATLGVVLNEYLKIAFDLCAQRRPSHTKPESLR